MHFFIFPLFSAYSGIFNPFSATGRFYQLKKIILRL